jgi:hypothetical protein
MGLKDSFIRRGYIPSEFIPPFKSESLANALPLLPRDVLAYGIGKETSRRWEQGDDLSMADFQCAEYSDGKTIADPELRERMVEIGIRKTARATKIDSKTIMLISRGEGVKPSTLAQIIEFVSNATLQIAK